MAKETKMKKVACTTVVAQCNAKLKEAKEVQALLDTVLSKVEKEWIPMVANTVKNATALRKKALDISVDSGENGMMEVAVNSSEGEQVSVQDNTQTNGADDFSTGDTGAPVDTADDMSTEDMQKTFKLMSESMAKISKALEKKTNKK